MLTDLFLHKQGSKIPAHQLGSVLGEVCVPLAGRRIVKLQMGDQSIENTDQLMMEFELCIGLIFKPLRQYLRNLDQGGGGLVLLWQSVLSVLEDLLGQKKREPSPEQPREVIPENLKATMNTLASEHFQSAIKVLISTGLLLADPKTPGDITAITWESVGRMNISVTDVQQWKKQAAADGTEDQSSEE